MDPISTGIAVGANLISGLMGKDSAKEARESNERIAAQNIALQKEFAQSGIQWKVADAQKAGLHPLAALGTPTTSFSNIVGNVQPDTSMARAVSAMGQDISRAVAANSPESVRQQMARNTLEAIAIERGMLQNDILKAHLASGITRAKSGGQIPPAIPADGPNMPSVTEFPKIDEKAMDRITPWMAGGTRVRVDPLWSDAKTFQDRYGDDTLPVQLYSMWMSVNDFLNHNFGAAADNWAAIARDRDGKRISRPIGRR